MTGYLEVHLADLVPNPDNPRDTLGDLDDLATSIAAVGILQRLLVTPLGDQYMVVDGHRRYWSMRSITYDQPIPVEVRNMDRADRLAAAVAAGTFTRPLSPIDQAKAFHALEELGLTRAQIEARTGCSQPMISTRLRLLELTPKQQAAVHDGRMTLHEAKLATYELGRRAPDRAPRIRRPTTRAQPGTDTCTTCGQPITRPAPIADPDSSHLRPAARAEAEAALIGNMSDEELEVLGQLAGLTDDEILALAEMAEAKAQSDLIGDG